METIRVCLVDDHEIIRKGIRALLRRNPEILIVGEAENGREALQLLAKTQPDVILMDIDMPVLSGVETTRVINQKYPQVNVLGLTMHNEHNYIISLLKAGAIGYLLKNSDARVLTEAIHTAYRGESYFPPDVSQIVLHSLMKKKPASYIAPVKLTNRELEILRLISQGYSNVQIAEKLFISKRTVDTHRQHLMDKLNVSNTASLVRYAIEHDLG